jgi:coenzyme F420-reducing hydrogenase delta subunit
MSADFEPEILVLYCGRCIKTGYHLSEGTMQGSGFKAKFIMLPCGSKIEVYHLMKIIEQGTDGVVVVVCPEEQCQFLTGSDRAARRVGHTNKLLSEVGMSENRVEVVHRQEVSINEFLSLAEEEANAVRPLGQNPMKIKST